MNLLNRAIAVVFALVLLGFGLVAIFLTAAAPAESNAYLQGWSVYLADQATVGNRLGLGIVAAILTIGGAAILFLERPRRSTTTVQLKKVAGGQGILSLAAIAQRVQHDAELLGGVRRVKPTVFGRGNKVDIRVSVTTDPYVEAAAKTQEVCQVVRDNVEGQMGVKVGRVTVRIAHDVIREASPGRPTSDVA